MSLATINSYAVIGVQAQSIHIEVHIANGLPGLNIVGLPEAAVRESKDRVRSAITNSGFEYPARRITVNLAPANLPKYGSGYDLAIAIGILRASEQIRSAKIPNYGFVGELSLSGQIRPIVGVLPIAVRSQAEQRTLILPAANREELQLLENNQYLCTDNLAELCAHLSTDSPLLGYAESTTQDVDQFALCLSDVQGQPQAKRILEIAASGGHSLLMQGPPGTGKTMLASRLPSILPQLSAADAIEVASIYSVSQTQREHLRTAPFRSPHHTASPAALVGGGSHPMPGEISLAHKGILFLDELPEFPSKVLEVMRQPIESGEIWISRAAGKTVFPARFQLIAAMNPCPCGYHGESRCNCSPDRVARYQGRISGPLLDRIDLHLKLTRGRLQVTNLSATEESSVLVRARVSQSRQRQLDRQGCLNSELTTQGLQAFLEADAVLATLAQKAVERMDLSMRALHRTLRTAMTIADLQSAALNSEHFMEALSYRQQIKN